MARSVFLGTHTPRLDEKGRLFLPAKFRDRLAGGLVVTKGQERCLFVYPTDEFERLATQMQQGPTSSKAVRDYLLKQLPEKQQKRLKKLVGLGSDAPVSYSAVTPAERQVNRRVEVLVVTEGGPMTSQPSPP